MLAVCRVRDCNRTFAVLWLTGVLHPVTGIANTAGFAICALGLSAWLVPLEIHPAMSTSVLFLHGLGQTSQAWNDVIEELKGIDAFTHDIFDQLSGMSWSFYERTDVIAASLTDPVHVVGLSLAQ